MAVDAHAQRRRDTPRARFGEPLSVRLDPGARRQLDDLSARLGQSRNAVVRRAIARFLADNPEGSDGR